MNSAIGLAFLVVVAVLEGATGFPDQELDLEYQSQDDDEEHLERKLPGCGTKRPCKIAGGMCQPLTDECDGELRTAGFYCKNSQKCGCCIPAGPQGCVFGDESYPSGSFIQDVCMEMQCISGFWNYTGKLRPGCGECQVWGDPHFMTFDNHTVQDPMGAYQFQGMGTYVITQQGFENNSLFGLNSTFVACGDGTVSCVNSAIYYEPGIVVSLSLLAPDNDCHGDNDILCEIQVLVNGEERLYNKPVQSYFATDGTVLIFEHDHIMADDLNCINIVGSKGLSVSFCVHTSDYSFLYVWPHASLKEEIYGLCGGFTGEEIESYTMRGGSLTDEVDLFAESWVSGDDITFLRRSNNVGRCTDPLVLATITAQCTAQNAAVCLPPKGPTYLCPILVGACVFDQCRVPNPDSYAKGYAAHLLVHSQISLAADDYCDCDFCIFKGCHVVVPAPKNRACDCTNVGGFRCKGGVVSCRWPEKETCKNPDRTKESCEQGGADSNCGCY